MEKEVGGGKKEKSMFLSFVLSILTNLLRSRGQ